MSPPQLRTTDPRSTSAAVPRLPGVDVGCDVVDVARVARLLERWPGARQRLFTADELGDSTRDGVAPDDPAALRRLAARFAAKEALVKLLGRPPLAWTDLEVRSGSDGAPAIHIRGEPTDIAVSLSHEFGVAMAVVARRTNEPLPATPMTPTTSTTSTPSTPPTTPSRS